MNLVPQISDDDSEKDSVLAAAKQVYDDTTLGKEAGDKYISRENACEDFETLLNKSLRLHTLPSM